MVNPIFTISLQGDRQFIAKLVAMPASVRQALVQKMHELTLMLQRTVQQGHLSGPTGDHTLSAHSGKLRRSVFQTVTSTDTKVTGIVGYSADVIYAAIHEFGGTVHVPEIVPTKAQALHFLMGGEDVFAKRVRAHDVIIPERAPLRTSLSDMQEYIKAQLEEAVVGAMRAP